MYAGLCVKHCATVSISSNSGSAANTMETVQQHASILLQVASDCQVLLQPSCLHTQTLAQPRHDLLYTVLLVARSMLKYCFHMI